MPSAASACPRRPSPTRRSWTTSRSSWASIRSSSGPATRSTPGSLTATSQALVASAGLPACLDALRPRWTALRAEAAAVNEAAEGRVRRGVGIAAAWYGIGNTSLSNPSEIEVGIRADGTIVLFSGATDIGQGSNTVLAQIAADALGVPVASIERVGPDTDHSLDAGKTSASRQTFVSGNATRLAALDLRRRLLTLAEAGPDASLEVDGARVAVHDGDRRSRSSSCPSSRWRVAAASCWGTAPSTP